MYPILVKFGAFELRSWSIAIALSFLVGIFLSIKRSQRFGVHPDHISELAIIIIITSIAGSRLWYVLWNLDRFRGQWSDIVNPLQHGTFGIAGLSMNGGVVLGLAASFVYIRIRKLDFLALGDTIAPSFLLGAGIHRLGGCFLNSCCYGLPTGSGLGIAFPRALGPYPAGTFLWPTQLFASALGFAGFVFVWWFERRRRRRFSGSTLWLVLLYYPVDRFIVDQFRYYKTSEILGHLGALTFNANHLLTGGVFILSAFFFVQGWLKTRYSRAERD